MEYDRATPTLIGAIHPVDDLDSAFKRMEEALAGAAHHRHSIRAARRAESRQDGIMGRSAFIGEFVVYGDELPLPANVDLSHVRESP